jgi:UV excision repair protein RAD23
MKCKVKMLKGEQFEVEIESSDVISVVKTKIEAAKPEVGAASAMKLIFAGRILENDKKFEEYSIKETDFLVVMASRPKPEAAAPTPAAAPAATPAAAPAEAPAATPAPAPAGDGDVPMSLATGEASLVTGGQRDAAVEQLVAMGFPQPEVERCLRAAFNNPDRAVEYLTGGIPEHILAAEAQAAQAQQAAGAPPAGGAPGGAPPAGGAAPPPNAFPQMPPGGGGGGGGAAPFPMMGAGGAPTPGGAPGGDPNSPVAGQLAALRMNPQFQQLAAMVQQNPAMLQQILPVLAQSNPQLMQLITENQEEFLRLLQEPVAAGGGMGGGMPPGGMPGGPPVVQLNLTPAEQEAVERLCQLGFPREAAVQAYLACDKNEEIAANYLFEHGEDLMGGDA